MTNSPPKQGAPAAGWMWLCALLNAAGWVLSAVHWLNRWGYVAGLLATVAVGWRWRRDLGLGWRVGTVARMRRRFGRGLPAAFLALAGLSILGGILYPPSNYDGLAYRIPRILHWLAAGQWHWVLTDFQRLNTRACGTEWVSAPLVLFGGTDRWLVLQNGISLLLLPGLVFEGFRRLGARVRVAWFAMWLVPTGYVFLSQAGSSGNDLFGAVFPLAAVTYALRARESGRRFDSATSALAAALMTGAKATNLPLLLPWLILFRPNLRPWLRRPVAMALLAGLWLLASFLPTAYLNWKFTRDWTGNLAEDIHLPTVPSVGLIWESTCLVTGQNLAPPILPNPRAWERGLSRVMALGGKSPGGARDTLLPVSLNDLQTDGGGGLGLGVWLVLGVAWVMTRLRRESGSRRPMLPGWEWTGFGGGLLIAAAVFLSKMSEVTAGSSARLFTPYYPLLSALLAVYIHEAVLRPRWFRGLTALSFAMAAVVVVLSPGYPLWPALTVLDRLQSAGFQSPIVTRMKDVYQVYRTRADAFEPLVRQLPAEARTVGFIGYDQVETSLWRPFGSRRIVHVTRAQTAPELRQHGLRYVILAESEAKAHFDVAPDETADGRIKIARRAVLRLRASNPAEPWCILDLGGGAQ